MALLLKTNILKVLDAIIVFLAHYPKPRSIDQKDPYKPCEGLGFRGLRAQGLKL